MVLKDIDSSKLLFDIHGEDFVDKFKIKFPEFNEYHGKIEERKVAIYICLICDRYSPLIVDKPDYYQRKYTVAHLAKFPMSKKEFSSEAEQIIVGENDVVNQTMVCYIASYGLPNYTLLMAFMALMSHETQKIFAGRATKDSQKIVDNASDRIQNLTRDFFQSGDYDEYSKIRQLLYARVEKERIRLRPEQIIRYLEDNGELPDDFNPYGDYKVNLRDDMVFLGDK
jgi:hypothetical protein